MSPKVYIIGIDGMDYGLTERFLGNGKLPNIAALAKRGTFLPLLSSTPPQSPVAWASLATGKDPGEHGIFDFIKMDRRRYLPLLSIVDLKASIFSLLPQFKRTIKAKTIWEDLSHEKLKVKILRWPCTFPAQRLNGQLLTGMGTPDVKGGLGSYSFYTTKEIDAKNKRGEIFKLEAKGGIAQSIVKGPNVLGIKGQDERTIPFKLHIYDNEAKILLDSREITLCIGKWTDWIEFSFPIKGDIASPAIGKFLLISTKPDIQLYLTPLNISPLGEIFPICYPSDYGRKIYQSLRYFATLGLAEDTNALNDGIVSGKTFLEMCDFLLDEKERIFSHELVNDVQLYACVFDTLDRIQHMFWDCGNECEGNENIIEKYYCKFDDIIGKFASRIDDDSLIIILSDHGFGPLRRIVDLNAYLRDSGFLQLKTGTTSPSLFKNVDFSQSTAYAYGFTGININTRGRDGKGYVNRDQIPKTKREIKEFLLRFVDEKAGKNVVKNVYDSNDIYSKTNRADAPDLVIGFEKGYRTGDSAVIGGVGDEAIKDNTKKWCGDHIFDPSEVTGIFISSQKIGHNRISVFDIREIIMEHMGI